MPSGLDACEFVPAFFIWATQDLFTHSLANMVIAFVIDFTIAVQHFSAEQNWCQQMLDI